MTDRTVHLKRILTVVCPLCGAHCPLPHGIVSPEFDTPDPSLPLAERQRRVALMSTWADPVQQILANECQKMTTDSHGPPHPPPDFG